MSWSHEDKMYSANAPIDPNDISDVPTLPMSPPTEHADVSNHYGGTKNFPEPVCFERLYIARASFRFSLSRIPSLTDDDQLCSYIILIQFSHHEYDQLSLLDSSAAAYDPNSDDDWLQPFQQDLIPNESFETVSTGQPSVNAMSPDMNASTSTFPSNTTSSLSSKANRTANGAGHRFICQPCSFSSKIKRDYSRHLNTRKHQRYIFHGESRRALDPSTTEFACPVQGCTYERTFTRGDNLWRHIKNMHAIKKQA